MKTFLSEMLDALTSAYTRKDCCSNNPNQIIETNIGKLFSILAWGLDNVKEQAELIQLWDDIDNARGAVLDRYGANFGVKRISSNDSYYRLAIKVKMMALLSGGDTDTVITTVSALLDVDPQNIDFEDVYPAKIALYIDEQNIPEDFKNIVDPIAQTIKRILAAGVGIRLYLRKKNVYRLTISMVQCSYNTTKNIAQPINTDRKSVNDISINQCSFNVSQNSSSLIGKDRKCKHTSNSAGGIFYHTHIKSKRIE